MWNCKRCGECCRHLLDSQFGMAVTPQERKRLKGGHFKPLTSDGKQITLYQFTSKKCPFLKDKECMVYLKRPLTCCMYPLSPLGFLWCNNFENQKEWPSELYEALKDFGVLVAPFLRGAKWRFNLVSNGWQKCEVINECVMM